MIFDLREEDRRRTEMFVLYLVFKYGWCIMYYIVVVKLSLFVIVLDYS